jgi:hypothetical protein
LRTRAKGQLVITWPGGSALSNTMTFSHGLADIPQVVASSNEANINVAVTDVTSTTVSVRASRADGFLQGTGSFGIARWIAVL